MRLSTLLLTTLFALLPAVAIFAADIDADADTLSTPATTPAQKSPAANKPGIPLAMPSPALKPKPKPKARLAPKKSSTCHDRLMAGYDPYANMYEALSAYHEALIHVPDLLAASAQEFPARKNDLDLALSSVQTYLTMIKLDVADDRVRWRKNLMMSKATWLGVRVTVCSRLLKRVHPIPQLRWMEKFTGGAMKALNWLNNARNSAARKKRAALPITARKAMQNLKAWIDHSVKEQTHEQRELTAVLCSRVRG